jgi:type I restriction enzyme, S subunit
MEVMPIFNSSRIATGYKRTAAGVIPVDWLEYTVGDLIQFQGGSQPAKTTFRSKPQSGYVRLIQIRDYKSDRFEVYVPQVLARRFCTETDIMIGRYGPPVFQISRGLAGAYNVALIKAIPLPVIDLNYAYFFLKNDQLFAFIDKLSRRSSGQTGVDLLELKKYPLPLPPLKSEQVAISTALTDADDLINSLEQLLTKKRQIKEGAMQELLTGKRRLPGFFGEWVPRSMADLFEFSGGLSASRDQLGDVGSCYLHYGDIHLSNKTYIDLDAEQHLMPRLDVDLRKVSSSALLRSGDVVFVDASEDDQGVSKHVVINSRETHSLISGLHTIVARPKTDELIDLYKRYCFQASSVHAQFRFYAVGTKVSGVSKGNIGKIKLNVPSTAEQTEIAACLAEMDAEISALESRLTKAQNLKQAMAQALLTGRIRLVEPTA